MFSLEGGAGGRHPAARPRGHRHHLRQRPARPRRRSARPAGAGSRCPGDVSVVGYDDSAFMNCTEPPLTTVRQPIEAMGRAAVELLGRADPGRPRSRPESCCSSRNWWCAAPPRRLRAARRTPTVSHPRKRRGLLRVLRPAGCPFECRRVPAVNDLRNLREILRHLCVVVAVSRQRAPPLTPRCSKGSTDENPPYAPCRRGRPRLRARPDRPGRLRHEQQRRRRRAASGGGSADPTAPLDPKTKVTLTDRLHAAGARRPRNSRSGTRTSRRSRRSTRTSRSRAGPRPGQCLEPPRFTAMLKAKSQTGRLLHVLHRPPAGAGQRRRRGHHRVRHPEDASRRSGHRPERPRTSSRRTASSTACPPATTRWAC